MALILKFTLLKKINKAKMAKMVIFAILRTILTPSRGPERTSNSISKPPFQGTFSQTSFRTPLKALNDAHCNEIMPKCMILLHLHHLHATLACK